MWIFTTVPITEERSKMTLPMGSKFVAIDRGKMKRPIVVPGQPEEVDCIMVHIQIPTGETVTEERFIATVRDRQPIDNAINWIGHVLMPNGPWNVVEVVDAQTGS